MPSTARTGTPWLLGLLATGLLVQGCQRAAPGGTAPAEPALARSVMPTRTASVHVQSPAVKREVVTSRVVSAHAGEARDVGDVATPEIPEDAGPSAGCVATVDELPGSASLHPHDRRLHGKGLLVAVKSSRRLMLFSGGTLEACWRIGLGFAPTGHKEVEGDGRTPEGWYPTSDKPWSTFDDAIAIHYPNASDAESARRDGRISRRQRDLITEASSRRDVPPQRTPMGGAVLIHGGGSRSDWTLGCIALDDGDLADLRARLPRRMKTDLLVLS